MERQFRIIPKTAIIGKEREMKESTRLVRLLGMADENQIREHSSAHRLASIG